MFDFFSNNLSLRLSTEIQWLININFDFLKRSMKINLENDNFILENPYLLYKLINLAKCHQIDVV